MKYIFLMTTLFLTCMTTYSQKPIEILQEEKQHLEQSIQQTDDLIQDLKKKKHGVVMQMEAINKNIEFRRLKMENISKQITQINFTIWEKETLIKAKEKEIERYQNIMKSLILSLYKKRNVQEELMLLFASQNLGDINNTVKYHEKNIQLQQYYKNKLTLTKDTINTELLKLVEVRKNHTALLNEQKEERRKLLVARNNINKNITYWNKRHKEFSAKIRDHKKSKKRLDYSIKKMLQKQTVYAIDQKLDEAFEKNKGNFLLPVKGTVFRKFGKQQHPFIPEIYEDNNGIDILTSEKEAVVFPIHKGTVSSIIVVKGNGKTVIVDHGKYRTIYANLKNVFVKQNQDISENRPLGEVLVDPFHQSSILHFEIWRIEKNIRQKLDPEQWTKLR